MAPTFPSTRHAIAASPGSPSCPRVSLPRKRTVVGVDFVRAVLMLLLLLLLGVSTIGTARAADDASFFSAAAGAAAASSSFSLVLPPEFSIRFLLTPQQTGGLQLVWDPTTTQVRIGGSRPEFRLGSSTVLGIPKETTAEDGTAAAGGRLVLALPLTPLVQDKLNSDVGQGGLSLQVWSSGRRLDSGGGSAAATASPSAAPALAPTNDTNSSSTPSLDPASASFSSNATTAAGTTAAAGVLNVKAAPTVSTNPAQLGPYPIRRRSYDLRPGINFAGYPALLEVVAEVTYPRDLEGSASSVGGPAPLVLFLHGRHDYCYQPGNDDSDADTWPCPSGFVPVPSHRGYRYVANLLASQGYVSVSIAANAINAQDYSGDSGASARSVLIRHHLNLWATWNRAAVGGAKDPWGGIFRGKLDLSKVVLVGHSRGGEGVNRAAIDAATIGPVPTPYKIVGLVSYGPTAFGRQVHPNVASATILPTCDGDVSDLQGQTYIDGSRDVAYSTALRSAVIVIGANHNYFNTEWTPGLSAAPSFDDWYDEFDPVCGTKGGAYRLTPVEQQRVGAAYTLALVRLAVRNDQDMLPLLDGTFVRPQAIGRANVVTHAIGGTGYRLLYKAQSPNSPLLGKGMKGYECQGCPPAGTTNPMPVCSSCYLDACSPHFLLPYRLPNFEFSTHPAPQAIVLNWTKKGAVARFKIDRSQRDFRTLDSVDVRVANDPDRTTGSQLEMWLVDGRGQFVKLETSLDTIEGWPGTSGLDRIHARSLRGNLASLNPKTRFNLKNVTQVALVARGETGRVWVLDVAASQRRVATVPALNLPVVSVDLLYAPEGNGPKSAKVKVTSDRPIPAPGGSIWVDKGGTGFLVPLPPGTNQLIREFTLSWVGDDVYSPYRDYGTSMGISAVTGAVVGNFLGGVNVMEDDPKPTLKAVAKRITVSEGQSLVWTFQLSSPVDSFYLQCQVVRPTSLLSNQTELSSQDVNRRWLSGVLGSAPPSTAVPLSQLFVYLSIEFGYAVLSANLTIPTLKDGVAEAKDEVVALTCTDYNIVDNLRLTGIVRAN